jgi:hypothetical protein
VIYACLVLGTPDFDSVMKVLSAFQAKIDLTAFEFFSDLAVQCVTASGDVAASHFLSATPFYALLEFEALSPAIEEQAMEVFEQCMEEGWVLNGVMSQNETQAQNSVAFTRRYF